MTKPPLAILPARQASVPSFPLPRFPRVRPPPTLMSRLLFPTPLLSPIITNAFQATARLLPLAILGLLRPLNTRLLLMKPVQSSWTRTRMTVRWTISHPPMRRSISPPTRRVSAKNLLRRARMAPIKQAREEMQEAQRGLRAKEKIKRRIRLSVCLGTRSRNVPGGDTMKLSDCISAISRIAQRRMGP